MQSQALERHDALFAVEDAQHDVLAVRGRLRGDAEIDLVARDRSEMRPSCGARVSAMFMPLMTLRRTTIAAQ